MELSKLQLATKPERKFANVETEKIFLDWFPAILVEGVRIDYFTLRDNNVREWFEEKLVSMRKSQEEKIENRKKFLQGLKDPYGFYLKEKK